MNLRWLFFDYTDPQLGLTRAQRRKVRERAYTLSLLHKPTSVGRRRWMNAAYAMIGIAAVQAPLLAWIMLNQPMRWNWLVGFGVAAIVLPWVTFAWLGQYTWKPHLTSALRGMGYDVCPQCGYWLRGLGDEVKHCPECGMQRGAKPTEAQR